MSGNDEWSSSRTRFVDGLRSLATFIESHVELPVPGNVDVLYSVIAETDEQEIEEVDRIAAILGVTAMPEVGGHHYVATVRFGPAVQYRAVAISEEWMEQQEAKRAEKKVDVITSEEWPI